MKLKEIEMDEYKVGAVVVITEYSPSRFYKQGLKALLVEEDKDGDWWANFRGQGNAEGSWNDEDDGIWCIGRPVSHFKLV